MDKRSLIFAGIGGLFGAGIVFAIFVPQKIRALQARAQASGSGGLRAQAEAVRQRITAQAEAQVRALARQTADSYLAEVYGITPARIQGIEALSRALGR